MLAAFVVGFTAKAGITMENLVSLQIFCSDISLFDRLNAVYRTYLAPNNSGPDPRKAPRRKLPREVRAASNGRPLLCATTSP